MESDDDAFNAMLGIDGGVKYLLCPICNGEMVLRHNLYRAWYGCLRWPHCRGSHSAHADGRPMGFPADEETKKLRREGHEAFEACRIRCNLTKTKMYRILARLMELPRKRCHFGMFNAEQCEQAIRLLTSHGGT